MSAPPRRDPLFNPGDRFPLGPPHGIMDDCHEGPSGAATRAVFAAGSCSRRSDQHATDLAVHFLPGPSDWPCL